MSGISAARGLDRRSLFLAGAAGALAPFAPNPSCALAQPAPTAGNPGHYHFRIGDIRATVVSAGLSRAVRASMPATPLRRT